MSNFDARYPPQAEADVSRLVLENPLAWIVSASTAAWRATPLPLRPEPSEAGTPIAAFIGHFARSNPHVELLRHQPRAVVLFLGINGYISPSWMQDRTQAPTWNYASVQYLVEVEFTDADTARDAALGNLSAAMESGRPRAWEPREMGPRYETLARRIAAFRATVLERRARFKLGQDEREDVYPDILEGLGGEGEELRAWMQAANPTRTKR